MAKNSVQDWDTNPDNNTDINGVNIAENCPPSSINNAIRTVMAQLATYFATLITTFAAAASDLWAGTDNTKAVTASAIDTAGQFQTLTDGTTITPDHQLGRNFTVTLGGSRTLAPFANIRPGTGGTIEVIQDATGGRALAVDNTKWYFPGRPSTAPLSTNANAADLISYVVRASGKIYATVTKIGI
jgi:hypothetical protein